jgi:cytochrome c-type biogenesis protein CcmH/NrfG
VKALALLLALSAAAAAAPADKAALEARRVELKAAVAEKPKDAELWRRLGAVEQGLANARGARKAFRRVVKLEPKDLMSWYALALATEKLSEDPKKPEYKAEAIDAWRRVLRLAEAAETKAVAEKHLRFLGAL